MKKVSKITARSWKMAAAAALLLVRLLTAVVHPAPPTVPSKYHVQGSYHPKEGIRFDLEKQ